MGEPRPVCADYRDRMKAHTISFSLVAAMAVWGAGCASTRAPTQPDYSQYPQYPTNTYPSSTNDPNRTAQGAVAGAAAGAVLGGIIGNNSGSGSTEKGAAIGAVAGGLAGAAMGRRADQREASGGYSQDVGYTVQSIPPSPVSEPHENPPPQPSPNAMWIRGHYVYTGNGYQWEPGRWEVPPPGARSYVQPSWQRAANGGYVYVRGHWQ